MYLYNRSGDDSTTAIQQPNFQPLSFASLVFQRFCLAQLINTANIITIAITKHINQCRLEKSDINPASRTKVIISFYICLYLPASIKKVQRGFRTAKAQDLTSLNGLREKTISDIVIRNACPQSSRLLTLRRFIFSYPHSFVPSVQIIHNNPSEVKRKMKFTQNYCKTPYRTEP